MHSFGALMRFIWRSSKRAAVFLVGVGLLAVGLIMFVTPGPGIVLVVAGLAVLATEFAWAEHLLDKAKEQAAKAGQSAQRLPGVAKVTATAGRLVPRRWRRATVTSVVVAETTVDGVVTAESITVTTATVAAIEADQPASGAEPPTAELADAEARDTEPIGAEPPVIEPPDVEAATAEPPTVEVADTGAPKAEPTGAPAETAEPPHVEPTDTEPPTANLADAEATDVQPTDAPAETAEPPDVQPTDTEPATAEPPDVQPTGDEPPTAELADAEATDVEATDVQPSDVDRASGLRYTSGQRRVRHRRDHETR